MPAVLSWLFLPSVRDEGVQQLTSSVMGRVTQFWRVWEFCWAVLPHSSFGRTKSGSG
ncbi:hypothetical protein GALMADRAFT_243510 [Galerina marginata CBS 339.88]|uniref:Uncharacterized protein n=1 Tax=Galerina marginata (strain CBS 339.88) TaxID=685588 RepID=A0A067TAT2_GALM3|nr:hypothetical protein GALMADRAFT_243510 [Galerina marginata CBS 339.88]